MRERVLSANVFGAALEHEPLPADEVDEGSPTTGVLEFGGVGDANVGIWEMSEGTARDTEVDEIFIVLSGTGSVLFEDQTEIQLGPGTAVRLHAGERTVWTISETLRKVYIAMG